MKRQKSNNITYLIVGQGIAGSILYWKLKKQTNRKILLLDSGEKSAASRVAPGIINPLAGKRLQPSWNVDRQQPEAIRTYQEVESELEWVQSIFHPTPIIRLIRDESQAAYFHKRQSDPRAIPYIGDAHPPGHWGTFVSDSLGSFAANGSGWLDILAFTEAIRKHAESQGEFIECNLDYDSLGSPDRAMKWRHWNVETVIFCEGWTINRNPWFDQLPFKPAKGEMLELESCDPHFQATFPKAIFNRGKWLLPCSDGRFKAGATYSWDGLDSKPTAQAKKEILEVLSEFIDHPFEVCGHTAGVRPIVKDYRPVLGRHPSFPRLAIFNGLGSKGVLSAPWLADLLIDHLEHGTPLNRNIDVQRFL